MHKKTINIMKKVVFLTLVLAIASTSVFANKTTSFYDFKMKDIKGKEVKLQKFEKKVVLVVNTASKCGLTPQYEGLEELFKTFSTKGFVVLGFPCNQFMGQEPGSSEEILSFCTNKYNVTFPMFEKIEVNGKDTHPLYVFLKEQQVLEGKNDIRWNFEKFLIDKTGKVVKRYSPKTKPTDIRADIERLIAE
jgi:glutathione peroxidase